MRNTLKLKIYCVVVLTSETWTVCPCNPRKLVDVRYYILILYSYNQKCTFVVIRSEIML